jgi:Zn-dependent metalloprotease
MYHIQNDMELARFSQVHLGLPVYGVEMQFAMKKSDGAIRWAHGEFMALDNTIVSKPRISAEQAEAIALRDVGDNVGELYFSEHATLQFYNPDLFWSRPVGETYLAYVLSVRSARSDTFFHWRYFISAVNGEIIQKVSD